MLPLCVFWWLRGCPTWFAKYAKTFKIIDCLHEGCFPLIRSVSTIHKCSCMSWHVLYCVLFLADAISIIKMKIVRIKLNNTFFPIGRHPMGYTLLPNNSSRPIYIYIYIYIWGRLVCMWTWNKPRLNKVASVSIFHTQCVSKQNTNVIGNMNDATLVGKGVGG